MDRETVVPENIYAPTWDFSQAVKIINPGSLVYLSGIMGYRPDGTMPDGVVAQSEQLWQNLSEVMRAAGGSLADIIKVTVYVGDDYLQHRTELREVRSRFFVAPFPASTLVQVAGFANPEYLIEVEAVAALP